MADDYPLIFIPQQFEKYKIYQPTLEEFVGFYNLLIPKKPTLIYPPEKPSEIFHKPKTRIYLKSGAGCLPILALISLFVVFMIITFKRGWDSKFSLAVFLIELLFIPFNFGLKDTLVDKKLPSNLYNKLLNEYHISLSIYQKTVEEYKQHKTEYEEKMASLTTVYNEKKDKIKQAFYFNALKPYDDPISFLNKNRGKHDLFFADKLRQFYPKSIYCDLVPNNYYNSYQPDIIYIDEETGLHIDIEIDEPYTLDKGEPIHFIGCEDGERNSHFLFGNWVVLRFTEKQVIYDTENCCKLISSIINNIKYDSPIENKVSKEKRWTYDEALTMSKEYYRHKYFQDPKYGLFS